jgi:hypothetical protein
MTSPIETNVSVGVGASVMRSPWGNPDAVAREIQGQFRQGTDKIVSRKFGAVAKVLWPHKTAAHLATIAGTNERTASRWLAGEFEPPVVVLIAVIQEMFKRE